MAKTATTPEPAIYCRKCSYDLRGQVEHRCPECGRPYDPADKKTFRRKPKGRAGKWIKRIVALLLIAAAPYAWLYYDWRQEQPAVKRMKELGATVQYKPISVPVFPWPLPGRCAWMLERVEGVKRPQTKLRDADLVLVARCRRLRELRVYQSSVSDRGAEAVCRLTNLRVLELGGRGITDSSAQRMAGCRQLEKLCLRDTSLTDVGLAHLCRLPELRTLYIESDVLTDAGLAPLESLPNLDVLAVYAPLLSDDGLTTLARLSRLKELTVATNRYTWEGGERLQKSLPICRVSVMRVWWK